MSIAAPIRRPSQIQRVMVGLCLVLILLQAADGISTYLALATGLAQEKNKLLIAAAGFFGWSIMQTVMTAKNSGGWDLWGCNYQNCSNTVVTWRADSNDHLP